MKKTIPTVIALLMLVALGSFGCEEPVDSYEDLIFHLGIEESFYPWSAQVQLHSLDAAPGGSWMADYDITVDFGKLREFPDVVEGLVIALVGEPVFDAQGRSCGITATAVSSTFTSAGLPISYYEGTLPVRALGNRRGSPFETVEEHAPGKWARGGIAHASGTLSVDLPKDIPPGYYRPHLEIFVRFKGSNTPIDLNHLSLQLGQWLDANAKTGGFGGAWENAKGRFPPEPDEFMADPQVLPEVKVGDPSPPHMAWTIFHDVTFYGQAGILPEEDQGQVGLLQRVRFPTPLTLYPREYKVNPGLPTVFPEAALADIFIGAETVPGMIKNYLDFTHGFAEATLTRPDGSQQKLPKLPFVGYTAKGPHLAYGGFSLDLQQTGDYQLTLTGTMVDVFGRQYTGGGTYKFTVAYPLSFSTPVKPGTNYLAGARFPAAAHINPPVPADVTIRVAYFPNSDENRAERRVFHGTANRFGHFSAKQAPLAMNEPGEYSALLIARYVDPAGRLWQGAQASAGVIAEHEPDIVLHGGRTYISPPAADRPHYGGYDRYHSDFEGGSSVLFPEMLCQFDYIFPYYSGDTLFIATTYPFESVVGIVLSMEAKRHDLAERIAKIYNPDGTPLNFPVTPRHRTPLLLPDVFKFSEDNFAYYRISAEHPDHLPILSANPEGLSPYLFDENNEIEAYTYMSVIRPGFLVMSLAFSGSFMGPCWIVSPNPYGGQINTSPNGDLPGDLYRVMAGLVVKDKVTGENHYDAYASAIVVLPPGAYANSVSAPGERPLMWLNGRELYYFIGMDTSETYLVGDNMILGGTVMPPTQADVQFTVTKPDGSQETIGGRSNRLGGFMPPRPIHVDQAGVYRVHGHVEDAGRAGDVAGTGDGEFYNFAVPEDSPEMLIIEKPLISRVSSDEPIVVSMRWPTNLTDAKITYSVMMPGTVLDEGQRDIDGHRFRFSLDPTQLAIQYPFIDTVNYATGSDLYADTLVMVFFLEATQNGKKVYDVVRVILRGNMLVNSRALSQPDAHTTPGSHHPTGAPHG